MFRECSIPWSTQCQTTPNHAKHLPSFSFTFAARASVCSTDTTVDRVRTANASHTRVVDSNSGEPTTATPYKHVGKKNPVEKPQKVRKWFNQSMCTWQT
jgi:hypothetical protein